MLSVMLQPAKRAADIASTVTALAAFLLLSSVAALSRHCRRVLLSRCETEPTLSLRRSVSDQCA